MEHEMWAEEINTESGRIAKLGRRKKQCTKCKLQKEVK